MTYPSLYKPVIREPLPNQPLRRFTSDLFFTAAILEPTGLIGCHCLIPLVIEAVLHVLFVLSDYITLYMTLTPDLLLESLL